MKQFHFFLALALAALLLAACEPAESTPETFEPVDWYVALDGDDGNSCLAESDPCATLEVALDKAEDENRRLAADYENLILPTHIFHIAAGTYLWDGARAGYPMATVQLSAIIIGAGPGSTIMDGSNAYGGIFVLGDNEVSIRDLSVQNVRGSAPDSCIHVRGEGNVTIQDVSVTNCGESGFSHLGTGVLMLQRVTSTENAVGRQGAGAALYGPAIVVDSTFSNNAFFGVTTNAEVTISDSLAEANGHAGIHIVGSHTTLNRVTLSNNDQDSPFGTGLEVLRGGQVNVIEATIADNFYGARLRDSATSAEFHDVSIEANQAAGVVVESGAQLRMFDSQIYNNGGAFGGRGGGLYLEGGFAEVSNSTIHSNQTGGVWVVLEGQLVISGTVINDNLDEFAVYIGEDASATIQRSQIGNRLAGERSALNSLGSLTLINSTVSGSVSTGVSIVSGDANISHSTIAENGNYGLRVFVSEDVSVSLTNTLVAENEAQDCFAVMEADVLLEGTNIDTDGSCGFTETFSPADLLLDVLADNGGPTLTHALMLGSSAIDAGGSTCPAEDQRGMARPLGEGCDVGAYEASGSAMTLSEGDSAEISATPTLLGEEGLTVSPRQDYNCRYGNSLVFDIADTLLEGESYQPVGIGSDSMWLQFRGPTYGQLCWAPTEGFRLFLGGQPVELPNLPQSLLAVVAYPGTPTPTPDPDESYDVTPTPTKAEPSATPTCTPLQIQNKQCP